jgi:AcrR family transcriptional regulator
MADSVRNREKSKERFLQAVGEILTTKGFAALKVNAIAETAGLDKKLIYKYFGGVDQLLDDYLLTKDFWSNVKGEMVPDQAADGGKAFSEAMLLLQYEQMHSDHELQKIILWRLSEKRKSLAALLDEQERAGEVVFGKLTDPYFGENAGRYRAVAAILVAGIYYLNLHAATNEGTFCGIGLNSEDGRKQIREALSFLNNQAFEQLK